MTGDILTQGETARVRISLPVAVIVLLMTWAASSLVTYGVMTTRIDWLMQRQDAIEHSQGLYMPRTEYDARQQDTISRLERIERKIDGLR